MNQIYILLFYLCKNILSHLVLVKIHIDDNIKKTIFSVHNLIFEMNIFVSNPNISEFFFDQTIKRIFVRS